MRVAAAKVILLDAAVKAVHSKLDSIFKLKNEQRTDFSQRKGCPRFTPNGVHVRARDIYISVYKIHWNKMSHTCGSQRRNYFGSIDHLT